MQTTKLTPLPANAILANGARPRTSLLLRVLNLFVEADGRYRQKQALKNLPDARLTDMGLTRCDAELAFKGRPRKC